MRGLKTYHLAILILLVSFASVSALLFTPALPSLGKDWGVSESEAQWTISLFLIGYALGLLPYGPLSNRYGRKKAVYIGVALAIFSSLVAYAAPTFPILLIARFFQALGSAVGLKISFTMISDQHEGARATQSIAIISLAFGITPGLATSAGGFITEWAGWRGCFLFLSFYSVFIGILTLFLPETAKHLDPEALKWRRILFNYGQQFRNRTLLRNALLVALATGIFYVFAALAPFIGMETIGLTPAGFGLWNLLPSAGTISGGLLVRAIAQRFDSRSLILFGILIIALTTALMGVFFAFGLITATLFFLCQYAVQAGTNFVWSNANARALAAARDKSNASAVIQFCNITGAFAGALFVGFFTPTAPLLLPGTYVLILLLMFLFWKIS